MNKKTANFTTVKLFVFTALLSIISINVFAGFVNPAFETGTLAGWTSAIGYGSNVVQMPRVEVMLPGIAPHTTGTLCAGGCLNEVHSENYSLRLFSGRGDAGGGAPQDWARVEQNDIVPTNGNACLSFWYAMVLTNKHYIDDGMPQDDAYVTVEVLVGGTVVVTQSFNYFSMMAIATDDGAIAMEEPDSVSGGIGDIYVHLPWTQFYINLNAYAGMPVTIRYTAYGCNQGGHNCYSYLDDINWKPCPDADIMVTSSNNPAGIVQSNENITYTLSYTVPAASAGILGVKICDTIPAGTSYVNNSATSNPFYKSVTVAGGVISWDMGYVLPGSTGTLTFSVTANTAGTAINNSASETDLMTGGIISNTVSNIIIEYSPSPTPTVIQTPTATPTMTVSVLYSATATYTPCCFGTLTPTFTKTATMTCMLTAYSLTATFTPTANMTPAVTPTLAPPCKKVVILFNNVFNPENPENNKKYRMVFDNTDNDTIKVKVFNKKTVCVRTLLNTKTAQAGWMHVEWDGKNDKGANVASGIYIVVIETNCYTAREKVAVIR
jgi:uncharacterized repeat protein (TIGR01451 family)